jgi:hypothetical protein
MCMKIFVILLVGLCLPTSLIAQSSDEIRYYILYDKSGSIPKVDRKQNLAKMLATLIEKNQNQINAAARFTIIPFGATISNDEKTLEYDPRAQSSGKVSDLITKINLITDYNKIKTQQFTNIHSALDSLLGKITNDKSSGIFIFTDGILNSGDYQTDADTLLDVRAYYKYLHELQAKVKLKSGKPVFLVQVSNTPKNPYYPDIEKLASKHSFSQVRMINDSTIFWLKNTEEYNPDQLNSNHVKSFAEFIARANDMILHSEPTFNATEESKIDKAVLLNNIVELSALTSTMTSKALRLEPRLSLLLGLKDNTKSATNDRRDSLELKTKLEIAASMLHSIKSFVDEVNIDSLQKTLKTLQSDAGSDKTTTSDKMINLIYLGSGSQAFKPATPTLNTLAMQANGIRSAEKQIISGVTDYIIERGKQEALYLMLERMNERILIPNKPLSDLLPELTAVLKNTSNYYDITLLRETFSKDFRMLPENIHQSGIFKKSESLTAMMAMLNLYKNITENQSLELAFRELSHDLNTLQAGERQVIDAIKFTANVVGYLSTNDLASIYNDKPKLEILSKLIVILSLDESSLRKITNIDLNNSADLVRNIYLQYRLVKSQIELFNKEINPNSDFDGYRRMREEAVTEILSRSSDLLFSGLKILSTMTYNTKDTMLASHKYQEIFKSVMKIKDGYFLIRERKYTQAALLLSPEIMKEVNARFENARDSSYSKHLDIANRMFVISAEVSEAQTPEAVKTILARYALPVASYRIKHQTSPNIMVNAYLGLGAGYFLKSREQKGEVFPVVSAPIGFDWSFKRIFGIKSVSLFSSIVDVGNVVSYKLWNKNNLNEDDVIRLDKIVSPGLFLAFSINKKLPLTINAGYSFNPSRISLSLNLDMPLFAIYRGR